jgi:hypothetical protein
MRRNKGQINLQLSPQEALKAKFIKTLNLMHGYEREARGEVRNFQPKYVADIVQECRIMFETELAALAPTVGSVRLKQPVQPQVQK